MAIAAVFLGSPYVKLAPVASVSLRQPLPTLRLNQIGKKNTMDSRGLLEQLIEFERRVWRVYSSWSARDDFSAELRFFWNCMAEDECHHLAILERSLGLLDMVKTPPAVAAETLTTISATVAAAEAVAQQGSLTGDEALRHALAIEGSELNNLDAAWFQGFRSGVTSLLKAMMPEEEIHLRRLVEAIHRFTTDEALQNQAAALWAACLQRHSPPPSVTPT
jgi:hypothetical protein